MGKMPTDVRVPSRKSRVRGALGRVGRWTLVAIVLGLALIGFLHLTRGTAVRHVRGVIRRNRRSLWATPEFPLMATMATGAWLAPGNRVEVLLNGDGTYPRLWEDLRSAKQSITLQLSYGARAGWPTRSADSDRASQSGCARPRSLRCLRDRGHPARHRDALRAGGIVVEPFRPIRLSTLHLAQNRSHVRGIVIDSRVGWTGGFGIDDKWFGDGRTNGSWRETNVRFEGPAVRQLQAAFVAAWVEATGVMLTGHATLSPQENGVAAAGLLHTLPRSEAPLQNDSSRFHRWRPKALYITNSYFAPERSFIDLLAAAAKRGVDVRILTAGPRTDVNIVRNAGRAWYGTLLDAGVRVFEWQPSTLHAKTFVADGQWSTIGSMNFDNRSMALNDESTLMILDPTIGRQMDQIFLDDLRHAEEITLTTFQQRSWWARLTERAANFVMRLL